MKLKSFPLLLAAVVGVSHCGFTQDSPIPQPPNISPDKPAQNPQLAAMIGQFTGEVGQIDATKQAAMKTVMERYVRALEAAEKLANTKSAAGAVAAILRERSGLSQNNTIPIQPEAELPRELISQRNQFLTEKASIDKAISAKLQAASAQYLRSLTALEQRAKLAKTQTLVDAVLQEKLRVAEGMKQSMPVALPASTVGKRSTIVNGDFSAGDATGIPEGWTGRNVQIIREGSSQFVRITDGKLEQEIQVPRGTRAVRISARVRCPDFEPIAVAKTASAGVGVYYDLPGQVSKSQSQKVGFAIIRDKTRSWKSLNDQGKIPEGVQVIRVLVNRWDCMAGTVDVDDIEIRFD